MTATLTSLLYRITLEPAAVIVELLLIGLCVQWSANVLQSTRGARPLRGVLLILVVATIVVRVLVNQFGWVRLELLYNYVLSGLALIALVVFQPELRRAIIRVGDVRFPRIRVGESQLIGALTKTAGHLSKNKYGGLVAIERDVDLTGWAENGTLIKAEVSANLLNSIFFPNSPLHDLGVIIRGDQVVAANCQFPSADSGEIDLALGSRHLAALGMSYETDALVMVVSEETGVVSLADNGKLIRYLSLDDLAVELETRLARRGRPGPISRAALWPKLRRALVVVPLTLIIWYLIDQATLAEANVNVELTLQHADSAAIVELVDPPARREPPAAARLRPIDELNSTSTRLQVSFVGSARQIDRLRRDADESPLRVRWVLSRADAATGEHFFDADDLTDRLGRLDDISRRGLSVRDEGLSGLSFRVSDRVAVSLRVAAETGQPATIEAVSPSVVTAVFRREDVARLIGRDPAPADVTQFAAERTLRAATPNASTSAGSVGAQQVTSDVDPTVAGIRAVALSPPRVDVALRIMGQKRTLDDVLVKLLVSPGVEERFRVDRLDANEWRIAVDVTGSPKALADIVAADIYAFVVVTDDDLPPPNASGEQLRTKEVRFQTPDGVTPAPGVPRTVRISLSPRNGATP